MRSLSQLLLEDSIRDLRDTDGRLVSEPTSELADDLVLCPYQDRRKGAPMNRGALQQIGSYWSEILDWVAPPGAPQSSLHDSLAVALLASIEPLKYDAKKVPGNVSARYKACLGFSQILSFLVWNDEEPCKARLGDYGTEAEFFRWLDREGWLQGQSQVCAGSQQMIGQLFERFCSARLESKNRPLIQRLLTLIALQSVHILANHRTPGSLAEKLFRRNQSPWLFALVHQPNRDLGEVKKLFCDDVLPGEVEELLERPADEELFLGLHEGLVTPSKPTPATD